MPEFLDDMLPEATAQTLELMAFIAALPLEGPATMPEDAYIVSLNFRGSVNGTVELATSGGLGQMLSENILGPMEDPSEAPQRSQDALKEALNVLCGTLLHQYCASGKPVEMSLPEIIKATTETWDEITHDEKALVLDADGQILAVRTRYKDAA